MPGGCSWTRNWLTFDNSYYTILHTNQSKRSANHSHSQSQSRAHSHASGEKLNEIDGISVPGTTSTANTTPISTNNTNNSNNTNMNSKQTKQKEIDSDYNHNQPTAQPQTQPQSMGIDIDTSQLLWTSADKAVSESPEFSGYFRQYATNTGAWFSEYRDAHVKFSNLGVRFQPIDGIDIHIECSADGASSSGDGSSDGSDSNTNNHNINNTNTNSASCPVAK